MSKHPLDIVLDMVTRLFGRPAACDCKAFEAGLRLALWKPEYTVALVKQLDEVHTPVVNDQILEYLTFLDTYVEENPLEVSDG